MSDNESDYQQIMEYMVNTKKQWKDVPDSVHLTLKAIGKCLHKHQQRFAEHKLFINEQSIQTKRLELALKEKISKKQCEKEIQNGMKRTQLQTQRRHQQQSISSEDYRHKEFGLQPTEIMEVETIVKGIIQKEIKAVRDHFQQKYASSAIQSHIKELAEKTHLEFKDEKQQLHNSLKTFQTQILELKSQMNSQINQNNAKITQQLKLSMHQFEQNQKKLFRNFQQIMCVLQDNFVNKKLFEQSLKKLQSQINDKRQENSNIQHTSPSKQLSESKLQRIIEVHFEKKKQQDIKEFNELKQRLFKESSQFVKTDKIHSIIETFQKQLLSKCQSIQTIVNQLDSKMQLTAKLNEAVRHPNQDGKREREDKRQKSKSPQKNLKAINDSLAKIEKTLNDKSVIQFKKLDKEIKMQIKNCENTLLQQLQRRQQYLCEIIEQKTRSNTLNASMTTHKQQTITKTEMKRYQSLNATCRYLYTGSQQLKKESIIIWQYQSINLMAQNVCKLSSGMLQVNSAGLYRVEVGIYAGSSANSQIEAYLLLDSDIIYSFANSFEFKGKSKDKGQTINIKSRGHYFSEAILISAKSKLSVRVDSAFYGQAFIQIQKL